MIVFYKSKENMHFVYEQLLYILHWGIYVANIRKLLKYLSLNHSLLGFEVW